MDFVVLKVNGKDVSSASHEDTIAAFTTAEEPIIVEVLKRSPKSIGMAAEPLLPGFQCDTSTQTEWTGPWDGQPYGVLPPGQVNMSQQVNNQSILNEVVTNHYSTIGGEVDGDEDDGCDVEYEEVMLRKNSSGAKLGLTLCYGAPDDPDTDIYISEIEPESVAGKDGRIQEGDQLLQINGVDVHSREQAVHLFSEKRPDFTLLLARPQMPVDDYFMEDNATDFGHGQGYGVLMEQEEEEETTDTGTTENAHLEKDSGVGKTDESTKNDESSDHEAAEVFSSGDGTTGSKASSKLIQGHPSMRAGSTAEKMLEDEIRNFRVQLSSKGVNLTPLCRFQSDASLDQEMALLNKEMENIQLECESLVNRHLESQQKVNPENKNCCLEHIYANGSELSIAKSAPTSLLNKHQSVERWVNSMVVSKNTLVEHHDRDSSSAYNTADSSGSLPLTLELTPVCGTQGELYGSVMSLISPKMEDKGTQLRESDVSSMFSCDSCRRCCKALIKREESVGYSIQRGTVVNNNSNNIGNNGIRRMIPNKIYQMQEEKDTPFEHQENNCNYVPFYPSPNTMYTNQANLQHTMWLQQQMFRQSLEHQKVSKSGGFLPSVGRAIGINARHQTTTTTTNRFQSVSNYSVNGHHLTSSSKSGTLSTVKEEEELKMEWKVKRRADGTRYITRRPVRNRLLKARAMKIQEERAGITTDDDAVSELKTGRYWTKEERKKHLERARDRKKKEIVNRTKMTSVREQCEDSEEFTKKELTILELYQKKLMRRRGKVVFDDFTTVQEVLAHGSKITNPGGKPLGLLTVTTV